MRYLYRFQHGTRLVEFGPHEDENAAKHAFQFRYGYWPEDAVKVTGWPGVFA